MCTVYLIKSMNIVTKVNEYRGQICVLIRFRRSARGHAILLLIFKSIWRFTRDLSEEIGLWPLVTHLANSSKFQYN